MDGLKVVTTSKGNHMYYKNGKLISKANYEMYSALTEPDKLVEDETVDEAAEIASELRLEIKVKGCIFCGADPTHERAVDYQPVALCDTHYYEKTLGEIHEQLRSQKVALTTGIESK